MGQSWCISAFESHEDTFITKAMTESNLEDLLDDLLSSDEEDDQDNDSCLLRVPEV